MTPEKMTPEMLLAVNLAPVLVHTGINSDPHALANAAQTLRYEARRLAR